MKLNNYTVMYMAMNGLVYTLQFKGKNFADAEKQAMLLPLFSKIIQITLFNN